MGFPGSAVLKYPLANAGDTGDAGLIPGSGRSLGVGNGNLLQYSCLENSMNRRTWWSTVHGVTESDTTGQLSTHPLGTNKTIFLSEKIIGLRLFHLTKPNSN